MPFRTDGPDGAFHAIRTDDSLPGANPADLAALGTALELRPRLPEDARVLVLSVGEAAVEEVAILESILRGALAAGADQVARIWLESSRSSSGENPGGSPAAGFAEATAQSTWRNARGAAQALRPMAPRLILTGEKSADSGRGCFGAFLAHELGADFAHRISRIDPLDGRWRVTARLEAGYGQEMVLGQETVGQKTVSMPAVVTVAGPPGKLPYPSLPAWIDSRTAEIPVIRVAPSPVPSVHPMPPVDSAAGGGESVLRVPMPRVKSYAVPEGGLSAEQRIGVMVGEGTGAGGAVFAEGSPEEQAEAALALLKKRGMVD
ncbi:MAG: hypothetical protein V3S64_06675 [bacterium]